MCKTTNARTCIPMLLVIGTLLVASGAIAQEVWSGFTLNFEKVAYADWTLEEIQDRLTSNVWITRKDNQGIFNIAQESGYSSISPIDTEWAYGSAADWAALTFATWKNWHGNDPGSSIGLDAVVHLISDDIYVDIRFLSFGGGNTGGGFSYVRGEADPVPVDSATLSQVKALY
jgi:hypothetical protein